MANIFRVKIMPKSPEENLEAVKRVIEKKIGKIGGKFHGSEIQGIAFGLKALIVTILLPDEKGTDEIENFISSIQGVGSVQTIDMRRAVG